ncbi:hypothetical protein SEA_BIG4_324 [Microbacterium phage Big4]|nr:hypothetical protein SEA_BIG4_324 [Microbacterium phage Big4]
MPDPHPYKKPGMTLWESLGLDIPANAPGGARMLPPSAYGHVGGTHRVTHDTDRDQNHQPEFKEFG